METATHPSAATLAHWEKHKGTAAMPVGFLPQHIETRTRASTAPPADFVPLPLETRTHVRTAIAGWHGARHSGSPVQRQTGWPVVRS